MSHTTKIQTEALQRVEDPEKGSITMEAVDRKCGTCKYWHPIAQTVADDWVGDGRCRRQEDDKPLRGPDLQCPAGPCPLEWHDHVCGEWTPGPQLPPHTSWVYDEYIYCINKGAVCRGRLGPAFSRMKANGGKPTRGETHAECRRCGACCWAHPDLPPFTEEELKALPADIRQVLEWFRKHGCGTLTQCCFLRRTKWEAQCLIYDHRPKACKGFKPGGDRCAASQRTVGFYLKQIMDRLECPEEGDPATMKGDAR